MTVWFHGGLRRAISGVVLAAALAGLGVGVAQAETPPRLISAFSSFGWQPAPPQIAPRPSLRPTGPFQTKATAALILDADTGEALFSRNAERPIPPASMTKIMTALMVFEAVARGDLSDETPIPVTPRATAAPGSSMFLREGQRPRVIDLLRGLIVQSGNDAAVLLAEAIAGSESSFAAAMTRRAQALGLNSATFRNATGLPAPGHAISVADLARLARHLRLAFPTRMPLFAEKNFRWSGVTQANRNPALGARLAGGATADGLKTGRTREAGHCVVATAVLTTPEGRAQRVIVVLAGLTSDAERARETRAALNWAFDALARRQR